MKSGLIPLIILFLWFSTTILYHKSNKKFSFLKMNPIYARFSYNFPKNIKSSKNINSLILFSFSFSIIIYLVIMLLLVASLVSDLLQLEFYNFTYSNIDVNIISSLSKFLEKDVVFFSVFALISIGIHEIGHFFCAFLYEIEKKEINVIISPIIIFGFVLFNTEELKKLSNVNKLILFFSGSSINLFLSIFILFINLFLNSYYILMFITICLLTGILNLVPFPFSDGFKLLKIINSTKSKK